VWGHQLEQPVVRIAEPVCKDVTAELLSGKLSVHCTQDVHDDTAHACREILACYLLAVLGAELLFNWIVRVLNAGLTLRPVDNDWCGTTSWRSRSLHI
jgi:hypothetical protein